MMDDDVGRFQGEMGKGRIRDRTNFNNGGGFAVQEFLNVFPYTV